MKIRPAERKDLKRIEETMVANTLFTEEEVRCAIELVEIFLDEDDPERNDYLTYVVEDSRERVQGFACFGPTPLTDRVYDLYWIAVDPATQKKGSKSMSNNNLASTAGRLGHESHRRTGRLEAELYWRPPEAACLRKS